MTRVVSWSGAAPEPEGCSTLVEGVFPAELARMKRELAAGSYAGVET